MQADDGTIAASLATSPGDAAVPKQDLARQLAGTTQSRDSTILSQLTSNPFFTAGFGLAALGTAAAFAQRGLRHGVSLLRRRLLVDVEINVKDDSYQWFLHWMTVHQRRQFTSRSLQLPSSSKPSQRATLTERVLRRLTPGSRDFAIDTSKTVLPNGAIQAHFTMVPGPGRHILRYRNAFISVNRVRDAKAFDFKDGQPWETITLTTLYSQHDVFQHLFREAHALAAQSVEGKTVIYNQWGNQWMKFGEPRRKRPLASVILDRGIKDRLVSDIQDFIQSATWYHDRGIPYRRGYLLHGPPGTGKSSFIQALAGHLDYDIAILNLSERGLTDDKLNHLLSIIPPRTLILLEDIDVAFANRRKPEADGYAGANVTFSGLLNALDGVASAEERIVFLTTNHVDRLDDALIRPGRVDMSVRLGDATRYQVEALWDRFYGDLDGSAGYREEFSAKLLRLGLIQDDSLDRSRTNTGPSQAVVDDPAMRKGISTAALQGLFLYNKGDMAGAVAALDHIPSSPAMQSTLTGDGTHGASGKSGAASSARSATA